MNLNVIVPLQAAELIFSPILKTGWESFGWESMVMKFCGLLLVVSGNILHFNILKKKPGS